jgi:hypothetical protein|tara:strand:- start:4757 stop:5155 length:399 start_codon:yes stop_codon:yes gene_type:complete
MATNYGLDDDFGFAPEDAAPMGDVLMAKLTVTTTETPDDYSGVPVTTTTSQDIPIPVGPAPMMMPVAPPAMPMGIGMGALPPGAGDPYLGTGGTAALPPGMDPAAMLTAQPPVPGTGSMGADAARQVMQQFG